MSTTKDTSGMFTVHVVDGYPVGYLPDAHADWTLEQLDLAYLHGLSAAILEHAAPQLGWTGADTVEERLVETMTSGARRAVFGAWPSFETLWAQA